MLKAIFKRILPREISATLKNYKILSVEFGQYKSMKCSECIDKNKTPIPWYTYPAIEYLMQMDFSNKTVFEYGSGNSTCFWARRSERIVAVEDDKNWHEKIKGQLPAHAEYHLIEDRDRYIKSINGCPNAFDIIIIDGNYRYECAREALSKLRDDGFIILDNSDWHETTSELLRSSDLIEVDMSGFGPINGYTWTTSFYFTRNVKLVPAHQRQPVHGIGSLKHRETQ